MVGSRHHSRPHKRIRDHSRPTLPRPRRHLRQAPEKTHRQNRKRRQRHHPQPQHPCLLRMVPQPLHDTVDMGRDGKDPPHPLRHQMVHRTSRSHKHRSLLPTPSRKQTLMDTPKLHALTLLRLAEKPITQERLTDMAETIGFQDTPQSLRSRMVELERSGHVHRVDRNGISKHNRPCWRWQPTKKGDELMQELFDTATPDERK
nr:MAG TPA: protein of unknown function (DUF4364) [Caudoviricetes sp.]